ncbi:MAG TPA: glycosyltransferase [Ktedonobacteraceae bacterium]|nr:glycosyltransferase [Ktedonobacteraceae bacterium]
MSTQAYNQQPIKSRASVQPGGSSSRPGFSVILCTYNRRSLILSALASLRRQTLPYTQFEVIVVDNHSSDGTLAAVQHYLKAGTSNENAPEQIWNVRCLSQKHNDLSEARKLGLEVARGEIVVFMDDDAVADPHFLASLQQAYVQTGADAIGGKVELRWEMSRPHWLQDEMLSALGQYAPAHKGFPLKPLESFSSCNFSVRRELLTALGAFSPLLSKRIQFPWSLEVEELCQRLHQSGCKVWYEPGAIVIHRCPASRLQKPYFVGKAYWEGRSRVLLEYELQLKKGFLSQRQAYRELRWCIRELFNWIFLFCIQQPLQRLAQEDHNELLRTAMARAEAWGHFWQRWCLLQHAPKEIVASRLPLLFVHSGTFDLTGSPLIRAMIAQGICCTPIKANLPLLWLWQHRSYRKEAIGIIHFYRAGAFNLTYPQRLNLQIRLWCARRLGLRIVTTDTGGWWQSSTSLRFRSRRLFERHILRKSELIITNARHPEQIYHEKRLQAHAQSLSLPGYRGYYSKPLNRDKAHKKLGLPERAGYVYLCLTYAHTEQEILFLLETFEEMSNRLPRLQTDPVYLLPPQLLLVGTPGDAPLGKKVLQYAATLKGIHLFLGLTRKEDIPVYMGACNVIVLPHQQAYLAGSLEEALLALSYERSIIAPDLPRFRDLLPAQAALTYNPASRESFIQACIAIQTRAYRFSPQEVPQIEARSGWQNYGQHLMKLYQGLLHNKPFTSLTEDV